MCRYIKLGSQLSVSKNLDQLIGRDETGSYQFLNTDLSQRLGIGQSLKRGDVDSLVLYTVDILEAEFGQTTLQRHLTAFKSNLLAITGTLFGTLMTASRSAAHTGTRTATDSFACLRRTISRF